IGEALEILFGNDDMAGRAGETALAGTLQTDVILMRNFKDCHTERRLDNLAAPVGFDEGHFRHDSFTLLMNICRLVNPVPQLLSRRQIEAIFGHGGAPSWRRSARYRRASSTSRG